jgi:pimeloyl-ACP methyl ester carboxylesterase
MTTFVLVHGAWHGGWCWSRVARILRAKGHDVFAPSLTGLGDRSHLLSRQVTLHTHVMDVANLLAWEDVSDAVLVGHSYGGMVISGAADREAARLRAMVYVDALVPRDGEASADIRGRDRMVASFQLAKEHGGWYLPPTSAAAFNVNEADRAWVDAKCTPQPLATFTEPLRLSGAYMAVGRKMYIRADGHVAPHFDAFVTRFKSDPAWDVRSLPCGHDIMVDMPDQLAAMLIDAAG